MEVQPATAMVAIATITACTECIRGQPMLVLSPRGLACTRCIPVWARIFRCTRQVSHDFGGGASCGVTLPQSRIIGIAHGCRLEWPRDFLPELPRRNDRSAGRHL